MSAAAGAGPEPTSEAELLGHGTETHATPDHGPGPINWWSCVKADQQGAPLGIVIVNFSILLLLLVRFVRKPLLGFLAERHQSISSDIEEAAQLHEAAQQRLGEIESQLRNLDAEVAAIRRSAIEQAEQEKRRIIETAQEEVEQIIAGADKAMSREVERAKRTLELSAISAGVDAARQLLRAQVSEADRTRLHREYVEQIKTAGGRS
jgi:F-type H+-transporting ATPase subunit b